MRKYFLKFWPIIFIFLVWFIFANPYFLKNKVPFPSTYQVNNFAPWSTNSKFWGPVKNGAMPDIITQIYPWKNLVIDAWKSGTIPLWNPYSFSGTPLLANYQSAVFSPFNILFVILPFVDAWSILVLIQPLMAGLFMYLLLITLNKSKVASLISSISFMFCGFITVWMGYATLGYAIIFLPLAIFAIEKYYISNKVKYLILVSLSIPLSFFSGHFQISSYFLIFTCIYVIYKFLCEKNFLSTLNLGLAIISGLLISMVQFLPSIEFYSQSLRGSDFLKNEVIPWGYISTFLAPDFLGNPVTRNDWFGHYAEWNAYIGVLPLMLAFYSIFSKNKSQVIFLFILSFIVLFLAFPTTLQDLFINLHIPVLSTSAASRIVVLYSFSFAILSAFGLDQLILDIKNKKAWKIIIWFLCFAIIFLILWIAAYTKLFIPAERIVVARNNLILPTSLFIISALIIFIWNINKKMTFVALSFLLLIVSFDMLRFVIKWMPFDPKNLVFPDTKTTRSFSKISGYNRVFGNLGGEASMYYRLPSVEGYDALYIKRYGELINFIEEGKPKNLYRSVVSFSKTGLYASRALNLLNIKYIVHKLADDYAGWTFPYWTYPKNQFKLIYRDNMYEFYENTQVFPRAFLVGQYRIVENPEKIMSLMFDDSFDLKKEIILEEDPVINKTEGDIGKVKIVSYQPNNIEISVEAKSRALLFLADSYYNGWKATIDGKNASVLRADYAFRAIPVNAGMHTVRFYYDPWSFKSGVYLSVLGLMGLLFIVWISRVGDHSMSAFSSQSQKGK